MLRRALVFWIAVLVFSSVAVSQNPASSSAWRRSQRLRHGINASEWFAQSTDYSLQRLSTYTTLDDIALMRRLGFDHVRLSIDPAIFNCRGPWTDCERVKALDAGIYLAVSVVLVLTAGVACVQPAWRASRLNPMDALRAE